MTPDENPAAPEPAPADAARKDGAAVGVVVALFAVLAIVVTVVIGLALTGSDEDRPSSVFTLSGELRLGAGGAFVAGTSCSGDDSKGYPDIDAGTPVTVYDSAGTVLATGVLGSGTVTTPGGPCVFAFTVPGVLAGEASYQVEVADRGKVRVNAAEAEYGTVAVTLG